MLHPFESAVAGLSLTIGGSDRLATGRGQNPDSEEEPSIRVVRQPAIRHLRVRGRRLELAPRTRGFVLCDTLRPHERARAQPSGRSPHETGARRWTSRLSTTAVL